MTALPESHKLPFELFREVCSVILDTGYAGSAEEYVQEFYGKPFAELTVCEAEMIVRTLGNKPGCLKEEGMQDGKETGAEGIPGDAGSV